MKRQFQAILIFTTVFASFASASQVDPRFDGTWAGVEIFPGTGVYRWAEATPQSRTVILISNSGQNLRVVSGFVRGNYFISPKSSGRTLIFYGSNGREGRKECRLEISEDGKALKENGIVVYRIKLLTDAQHNIVGGGMSGAVYATFHRAGPPSR